jgi:hypothetical protein
MNEISLFPDLFRMMLGKSVGSGCFSARASAVFLGLVLTLAGADVSGDGLRIPGTLIGLHGGGSNPNPPEAEAVPWRLCLIGERSYRPCDEKGRLLSKQATSQPNEYVPGQWSAAKPSGHAPEPQGADDRNFDLFPNESDSGRRLDRQEEPWRKSGDEPGEPSVSRPRGDVSSASRPNPMIPRFSRWTNAPGASQEPSHNESPPHESSPIVPLVPPWGGGYGPGYSPAYPGGYGYPRTSSPWPAYPGTPPWNGQPRGYGPPLGAGDFGWQQPYSAPFPSEPYPDFFAAKQPIPDFDGIYQPRPDFISTSVQPESSPVPGLDDYDFQSTGPIRHEIDQVRQKLATAHPGNEPMAAAKNLSQSFLIEADQSAVQGDEALAEDLVNVANELADTALGLVPGVGWVKDGIEAVTGRRLVDGAPLSVEARAFAVLGVVTAGFGSKLKVVGKIGSAAKKLASEVATAALIRAARVADKPGLRRAMQYAEKLEEQYAKRKDIAEKIVHAERLGSGLKDDKYHRAASFLSKEQLEKGKAYASIGNDGVERTLLQTPGELNGKGGIFEYILDPGGNVVHQRFIEGGVFTGLPNQRVP